MAHPAIPAPPAAPRSAPAGPPPALEIDRLEVRLPDGQRLLQASLSLPPGRIAAIMGPSGSGKTTLLRALTDSTALEEQGFRVHAQAMQVRGDVGVVPQGGAAFDHVDVAGNIALALRNRKPRAPADRAAAAAWLARVDLPAALATPGTPVANLSGGMVQRLCIARTLAAGHAILILDEPSSGLDLARVQELAATLRKQAQDEQVAVLLVTHDSLLAALAADEVYAVGTSASGFEPIELPPRGADPTPRRAALERHLGRGEGAPSARPGGTAGPARDLSRRLGELLGAVRQPWLSLTGWLGSLRAPLRDRLEVLGHAYRTALLAPALFYAVVSVLLGYTVLYVMSASAPLGIRPTVAVEMVGGSYVVALTPPLSGILFAACSGATVNAWLATMGLTGQVLALRSLGIPPRRYLWGPVYEALAASYAVVALLFGAGLLTGGVLFARSIGVDEPFLVLSEDLLYPRPERLAMRTRALFLIAIYALGIASEVVWRASRTMRQTREVPRSMTTSIVLATLWIVALELVTAMWMFEVTG